MTPPPERTSGGIWLAEGYQENYTEALVVKAGPGAEFGFGNAAGSAVQSPMWAQEGETVLFQKHAFHPLQGKRGFVADHMLVAKMTNGEVEPLNDWVLVHQDPDITLAGSVVIHAEEYRPKPMHGTVVAYGPGRVRWEPDFRAVRWPVPWDMGLNDGGGKDELLIGNRVYWDHRVEMLSCGREELEFLLVAARDLWGMEIQ